MPEIIVDINISAQVLLQYYKGIVTNVSAVALDGHRVQFPINLLRPFMSYAGVNGRFAIQYSDSGKCQRIIKQ